MKIKITLIGLLLSIISYAQELPTTGVQIYPQNTKKSKTDNNKVYTEVEQAPEFPGGINAFRKKFIENLDFSKIEAKGVVSSELNFTIEKDGTLTDLKAKGKNTQFNSSLIAAVKSIKMKWIPGKMDGDYVRSTFRMPLRMVLE
ncbi:hypothetical protein [Chryseobacterium sp. ISL-6]|uniref:energy transducer TonB n=1 Tax=Chryseobacterium sp. ISL-6 TaxID=2819143 RepID=UPI001BE7CC9B|nr:hypothetical protein [Chryseobacterium sp. ISL-6]MBT2623609.1 hypothetical protein [Chryseobacterium sp. ISL-6]